MYKKLGTKLRHPVWWCLLILLLGYSLFHLVWSYFTYVGSTGDFDSQFQLAKAWVARGNLPWFGAGSYPFFYHILLRPLTGFTIEQIQHSLRLLTLLLFLAGVWLCILTFSRKRDWALYCCAAILSFNYWPALETIALFKVEMMEFFLLCVMLALLFRWRPKGTESIIGILIAFGANLKYLPGIYAWYYLCKRRWQILVGVLFGSAIVVLALVGYYGMDNTIRYATSLPTAFSSLQPTGQDNFIPANQAINGVVFRILATKPAMQPDVPAIEIGRWFALGIRFVIFCAATWLFYRLPSSSLHPDQSILEFLLAMVVAFLIVPVMINQYAILLLPAFLFALCAVYEQASWRTWSTLLPFCLAYILIGHFVPLGILNLLLPQSTAFESNVFYVWWYSLPFIGYLLLGFALLRRMPELSLNSHLRSKQG